MRKYLALASALMFLVDTGCVTAPPISSGQWRAIQVHRFAHVRFDTVYRAFKQVLQDSGYRVKEENKPAGRIIASLERANEHDAFFANLNGQRNYQTGEGYQLTVSLRASHREAIEAELTIQRLEQFSVGGRQGQEIYDPELYRSFYKKVEAEVERRQSRGQS